jgi:adenosylcobinamide-GDP ribazoletransferase
MNLLKRIAAAFQFLTVLPLPVKTGSKHLEQSMTWFPLVGMVVGMGTGYGFQLFSYIPPPPVAAVLTILTYILLTRGLHLDGYMDTIDGFFSHRKPEEILRIMKDPVVGSFAVLGTGVWFLLLFSALPLLKPVDHIMIHTTTRFQVLVPALLFSYPRESGTGKFFVEHVSAKTVSGAFVLLTAVMAGYWFIAAPPPVRMIVYGGCLLVSLTVSLLTGYWSKRKIGGITGDVLGFSIECSHMVLVVAMLTAYKYLLI